MKRPIFLIVILMFSSLVINAQTKFVPETNIGIKIGGITPRVVFDPPIDQNIDFNIIGGFVFRHISEKSFGIQIELNYLQAGWNESLYSTNTYQRQLNYIQLPLMTHINLGAGKTKIIVNVGPYLSFLVSENEKINIIDIEEEKDYYRSMIENKVQFGLCMGLGFSRYTSFGMFHLEGRISLSLSNIFENTSEIPFDSSRTQIAELALYYLIDLK
ncbi:MAG: PorT family protein [archaeon]|nr:PorT family protein [archaeon]